MNYFFKELVTKAEGRAAGNVGHMRTDYVKTWHTLEQAAPKKKELEAVPQVVILFLQHV